ncbi:cyclopropane-fatty-acyl-phospholipid synthase [Crossiella equi]|uniref:Cyclopropane-fatty-acyl-phospholipid synthase n=1 Tax=Crossiella equi TaxID=130796 RepID=A0ABS5AS18_9PSEU|nr:class I SAM-dependent methyltransferase [Crossiella equi]MBP2479360.1 cyclopropane-fatty-acyl-phospholipid synthase [Crossiella equi]
MTVTTTPDEAIVATNTHYALPPEIFTLFLDKRMKYSCGLYDENTKTLEEAQENKLAWIIEKQLKLSRGQRLLDVGCGWGSLTLFAAEKYGIEVVGVTPSAPQREHILAKAKELGVEHLVDVRLGRFTATDVGPGRFHGAAMLGSIVHMPDRVKVCEDAAANLHPKGRLYISESTFRNARITAEFASRPGTRYVGEEIFGFTDMVPLTDLVAAAEDAGLSIVSLTDLSAHYPRTIDEWAQRVRDNREAIDAILPGTADRLLPYFEVFTAAFGYTTKHYAFTAEKSRLGTAEVG